MKKFIWKIPFVSYLLHKFPTSSVITLSLEQEQMFRQSPFKMVSQLQYMQSDLKLHTYFFLISEIYYYNRFS